MTPIAHKLCLIGEFGVGKTSLVARFVRSTFSDKYLTTVGVKVDSKDVARVGHAPIKFVIWDIAGRSTIDALAASYLRGASALLLVADGTRADTLGAALDLLMQARTTLPDAVAALALNKADLADEWEIAPAALAELRRVLPTFETSALSGAGVEAVFADIAARLPA